MVQDVPAVQQVQNVLNTLNDLNGFLRAFPRSVVCRELGSPGILRKQLVHGKRPSKHALLLGELDHSLNIMPILP